MKCDSVGEFVSALCDGEVIPRDAAEHIGTCPACQARLRDYLDMGVELRRVASLESAESVPARDWSKPQGRFARWWQKGWGTMRIPRVAFVSMFLVIMGLAASLLVVKVGAHSDGTVVLLSTMGPKGPLYDCPLSTFENHQECSWFGDVGSQHLAYKVEVLSREGNRVQLAIRTRIFHPGDLLDAFTRDTDPAAVVKQVWFEPGEPLKFDVPEVGAFTLTGVWMDHVPFNMGTPSRDFSADAGEIRMIDVLLLKDKVLAGDMAGLSDSINSADNPNEAMGIYVPGEGRFLLYQLPMKGAVEAYVNLGRITFEEGGHSWEFVAGAPIAREHRVWVLHQPDFKLVIFGRVSGTTQFANVKLVQSSPGVWEPKKMTN